MICPELIYYPSHDSVRLAARCWRSSGAIADLVCLHGIISHSGWYEASASHLASAGMNVHFLDRRGSGLNPDSRGDVEDWETWIADVVCYLKNLPAGRPKILLGISWGGILATSIVRRYPEMIDGLALICPGLFSKKAANAVQRTALRFATAMRLKKRRVEVPLQDPALFTNSAKWQSYIAEDPFTLREITIEFAMNNLALLRYAVGAPEQLRRPVLLMLASEDPITDNEPTRRFVERMADLDKTIIEYAGASHTLEFESDPSQYLDDLSKWCIRIARNDSS